LIASYCLRKAIAVFFKIQAKTVSTLIEQQVKKYSRIVYTKCILILMKFEWDENKNQQNRQKHGISFEEAKEIFSGIVCKNSGEWVDKIQHL
jgi:hypothetical protein